MANRNPLGKTPEAFSAHCRQMDRDQGRIATEEAEFEATVWGAYCPLTKKLKPVRGDEGPVVLLYSKVVTRGKRVIHGNVVTRE